MSFASLVEPVPHESRSEEESSELLDEERVDERSGEGPLAEGQGGAPYQYMAQAGHPRVMVGALPRLGPRLRTRASATPTCVPSAPGGQVRPLRATQTQSAFRRAP